MSSVGFVPTVVSVIAVTSLNGSAIGVIFDAENTLLFTYIAVHSWVSFNIAGSISIQA